MEPASLQTSQIKTTATNTGETSPTKKTKPKIAKAPISKNLQVESSALYFMLHEYFTYISESPKELNIKQEELKSVARVLARNIMERISEDQLGRLKDKVEVMKFLCKDFWTYLFGKIVDKLQTDSKGTYRIIENEFKFLKRLPATTDKAKEYISLCGKFFSELLKGALLTFNIESEVTLDTANYQEYSFTVKIK
mmetsp:Transcript_4327/g.4783  ORF Transcript_4327/g.4783 Transcript_4327/m.4783 type:complete len:195 (-) Transcript_4327:30-614(-)